jgi:hypothetical protein
MATACNTHLYGASSADAPSLATQLAERHAEQAAKVEADLGQMAATFSFMEKHDGSLAKDMNGLGGCWRQASLIAPACL